MENDYVKEEGVEGKGNVGIVEVVSCVGVDGVVEVEGGGWKKNGCINKH